MEYSSNPSAVFPFPLLYSELLSDVCALGKDTAECIMDESRSLYQHLRGQTKKTKESKVFCFWIMLPPLARFNVMKDYLDVQSIVRLNTACTNAFIRTDLLVLYANMKCVALNKHVYRSKTSVNWVISRQFNISRWNMRVTIPGTMTSFQWVCQERLTKVAENMLLSASLDANMYSHYPGLGHMNPIALACLQHDHDVLDMLLRSKRVRVNCCDMYKKTPLQNACMQGSVEIVRKLLEAGAVCNTRDVKGMTPLIHATILNQKECVKLLLQYGASPALKNDQGLSALAIAQQYVFYSPEVVSMLQAADTDEESKKTHSEVQEWPLTMNQLVILCGTVSLLGACAFVVLKLVEFFLAVFAVSNICTFWNALTVYGIFGAIKMVFMICVGFLLFTVVVVAVSGGGLEQIQKGKPPKMFARA